MLFWVRRPGRLSPDLQTAVRDTYVEIVTEQRHWTVEERSILHTYVYRICTVHTYVSYILTYYVEPGFILLISTMYEHETFHPYPAVEESDLPLTSLHKTLFQKER